MEIGRELKTTDKLALWGGLIWLIVALGTAYVAPFLPWWADVLCGGVFAGGFYKAWLKQLALENVANMKNDK